MTRLVLSIIIALLRTAGVFAFRRYRSSHNDQMRQVALLCFLVEAKVRIERDRQRQT